MPTKKFDKVILMYKSFLAIIVSLAFVTFNFWVGNIIKVYPVEYSYYMAGVIVGIVATVLVITMLLGLKVVERKI